MNKQKNSANCTRARFAPSPTGFLHLGSVRTAVINYIFARQNNGKFILRIEDTDPNRNFDPEGTIIIQDLNWLGLNYDEGPIKGGPCEPYIQSKRLSIYKQYLDQLIIEKKVYRCFCTQEELEKSRLRQKALKKPPRYEQTCLKLNEQGIESKLLEKTPYIWRFKLDSTQTIEITDLARGKITFNLKNFSDFPITRQDGTFTFMFANFVDDLTMEITDIFRGEDHISNTAGQAALYKAFNIDLPKFYHMPIIVSTAGKKLSKRDFGFSLKDLNKAGYLPEAINNYLAIIGGSYSQEIMSLEELVTAIKFDTISSAGYITYDVEKLKWVNHKWIMKLTPEELTKRCKAILEEAYPEVKNLDNQLLVKLVTLVQKELITLNDIVSTLEFYFKKPTLKKENLEQYNYQENQDTLKKILENLTPEVLENPEEILNKIKEISKANNSSLKFIFKLLRVALTGSPQGLEIKELLNILPNQEIKDRIKNLAQAA